MKHILHRLDYLTDVILVRVKKKILHQLFLITNVIYYFFILF